jgi:hypothetical protein
MNLNAFIKRVEKFTVDNSPAILTGVGIAGTFTTAFLTGRATLRAVEILETKNNQRIALQIDNGLDKRECLGLVWKEYLPPVVTGLVTVSAIFGANHVSSRRATAMATAYSLSERAFNEYREKVVEKVGEKKERAYRDEIAQERVQRNPHDDNSVIITDTGEVLCFDQFSGRYFRSSMESLRRAENDINKQILSEGYATLSEFYQHINLSPTSFSDDVGWNTDYMMTIIYSTVLSKDNRPCIAIDFDLRPSSRCFYFAG